VRRELAALLAALDAALARLREMMSSLLHVDISMETSLDEVKIFQELLKLERGRISVTNNPTRRATVTERSSVRHGGHSESSFSHHRSTTRSSTSTYKKRDSSADSGRGFSKAATPDGTLDNRSFSFDGEGRHSQNSQFLDKLMDH